MYLENVLIPILKNNVVISHLDEKKAIRKYIRSLDDDTIPKKEINDRLIQKQDEYLKMLFPDDFASPQNIQYFKESKWKKIDCSKNNFVEKNFFRRIDLMNQYIFYYDQSPYCENLTNIKQPMLDFLKKHHLEDKKKLKKLLMNHPDYLKDTAFKANIDKNQIRNLNGETRVMDRKNLFYLLIQLKVKEDEAKELFKKLDYIYTYQANPFDLLYNVAIAKHFSIKDTYELECYIRDLLTSSRKQTLEVVIDKNELTKQIFDAYDEFIQVKHSNPVLDLKKLIDELFDVDHHFMHNKFHFYSNTIYKTIFQFLYDQSKVYQRDYLKEDDEYVSPVSLDENIHYDALIKKCYMLMNANMNDDEPIALDPYYFDGDVNLKDIRSNFKNNERHRVNIYHEEFKMEHYIDRPLILAIAFLTGHTTLFNNKEDDLNVILSKLGNLNSKNSFLDPLDPFDAWFINGCMYVNECLEYGKLYPINHKRVLENGLILLHYTKTLFVGSGNYYPCDELIDYIKRKSNFRTKYISEQELQ